MKITKMIDELIRIREEFGEVEVFIAKQGYSQESYLVEQSMMCRAKQSNPTCAFRCDRENCRADRFEGVIIH